MYLVYYRRVRNNNVTFRCIYNPRLMIDGINSTKYFIASPKIHMELNQAGTFEFTMPPGNVGYDDVRRLTDEILVYRQVFVDNIYIQNAIDPGDIYDEEIDYVPGTYDVNNKPEYEDDAPIPDIDDDEEGDAPTPGDNTSGDGEGDAPTPSDNTGGDGEGDAPTVELVGAGDDEELVGAGESSGDPYDLAINGFEMFWRGRIIQESIDMYGNRKFTCEGDLAYLNDTMQEEYYFAGKFSTKSALDYILHMHNTQVDASRRFYGGRVDFNTFIDDQEERSHISWVSTMDLVMNIVETVGGFINIRWQQNEFGEWLRYLDILSKPYRECTQIAEYGKNVLDLSISYDMTDFCTVVLPLGMMNYDEYDEEGHVYAIDPNDPYGIYDHITIAPVNNGNVFLKNSQDVSKYGWICKRLEYTDIEKPKNLKKLAQAYLNLQKFESLYIEVKIMDLHDSDIETDYMKMLDNVRVVSKLHDIDKKFMIVGMDIELDNAGNNTITLSASNVIPKALTRSVTDNQGHRAHGLKSGSIK